MLHAKMDSSVGFVTSAEKESCFRAVWSKVKKTKKDNMQHMGYFDFMLTFKPICGSRTYGGCQTWNAVHIY